MVDVAYLSEFICLRERTRHLTGSKNESQTFHFVSMDLEKFECSTPLESLALTKLSRCSYDPQILMAVIEEKDEKKGKEGMMVMRVRLMKPFRMKDYYLQLLLHLNDDFDDDLLLDSLRLLNKEE